MSCSAGSARRADSSVGETVPIAAGIAGAIAQFASFRAAFGLFAVMCAALVYPYLRIMTTEVVSSDPHG